MISYDTNQNFQYYFTMSEIGSILQIHFHPRIGEAVHQVVQEALLVGDQRLGYILLVLHEVLMLSSLFDLDYGPDIHQFLVSNNIKAS